MLNSRVFPISQVVLKTGFTVHVTLKLKHSLVFTESVMYRENAQHKHYKIIGMWGPVSIHIFPLSKYHRDCANHANICYFLVISPFVLYTRAWTLFIRTVFERTQS